MESSRAEERRILLLLTGQIFFTGLTLSLLDIAGSALFLAELGSEKLPWVYIAVGVFVSALSYFYATLQKRRSLASVSVAAVAAFAALMFAARLALALPGSGWVAFVLMVAFPLGYQMTFVVIGGQAGRLLDVRQMKRLFPLILAGLIAGFMTGGLILPLLTRLFGATENLLQVAGASMSLALVLLLATIRKFRPELAAMPESGRGGPASRTTTSRQPAKSLPQLLSKRYVGLLFSYQMLSAVGTLLVLFIMLAQAALAYPRLEDLSHFFGHLMIGLNLITLLFLAGPAGFLLNRFGLSLGLMANPVAVAAIVVAMLVTGAGAGLTVALFFWLAVSARILDITLSVGTTSPSIKATYQALPAAERPVVETAVEGIGVPMAFGIAGVILLVFDAIPGLTLIHTASLALVVTVFWTAAGLRAYREYRGTLRRTLSRRTLNEAELSLADASSLNVIESLLASGRASEIRLALDVLERAGHESLGGRLLHLVGHADPEVRREALGRVERLEPEGALPAVTARFETETDAAVRGAAVRTFCALAESDAIERAAPYLEDSAPEVRRGALVGLLRYGGIAGVLAAGERLTALARSPSPAERAMVAEVIGEVGTRSFYQPLTALLADEDRAVRGAALMAAGRVGHPRLLPPVIANRAAPATRSAAMAALHGCGEEIVPVVGKALAGETPHDEEDVIRLVRACGEIRGERVVALLEQHLDHPDDDVQYQVLVALDLCGFRAPPGDRAEIERALTGEAEHGLRILRARQELGEDEALRHLHRSLDYELVQVRKRVFLLLSFLYDARALLRAEEELEWGSGAQKALALEMLDVTLPAGHKALVFPLVDPRMSLDDRSRQLGKLFDVPGLSRDERLREIVADPGALWTHGWTRACAIHAAAELGAAGLAEAIEAALAITEPPIRETAAWALHRLDPARFERHAAELARDANPQVARLAASLAA